MTTFTATEQAQINDMVARIDRGEMDRALFVKTTERLAAQPDPSPTRQHDLAARRVVEERTAATPHLCTCPRCGHPAQHEETPHGEGYITCGHCAAITFDRTEDDEPAAEFYAQAQVPIYERAPEHDKYTGAYAWRDRTTGQVSYHFIGNDPNITPFDAPPPPPTTDEAVAVAVRQVPLPGEAPTCRCGAPAAVIVTETVGCDIERVLCDTCFRRDYRDNEDRWTAWEVTEWLTPEPRVDLECPDSYRNCQEITQAPTPTECAICYSLQPCYDDGEAWICIDRAACSRRQAENRTPASEVPAPLSPVEALRLALDRGVFGLETRAKLVAALGAADQEAITRAEQLAAARQHAGQTWETWQEERAMGAPF